MAINLFFRPRLVQALDGYGVHAFVADLLAGITVGIVALPLAIAFAIASGLRPEAGLYTAIVAGFLISALGGSRVQIGGPAGAFIVIVYGIVEQHGVANLLLATMMAGVILIIMGYARVGALIRHIPVSIVIGFTNGIAVLIALSQVKDFLGLKNHQVPAEFFAKIHYLIDNAGNFDPATLGLGLVSLLTIVVWPKGHLAIRSPALRILAKVPSTIMAVVVGTVVARWLNVDVATIGSQFGGIPQALPHPVLPDFDWQGARQVLSPALTIALLCAIESLLCARVADNYIGDRHDPNQELVAQGIANLVAPLFGGFCATGAIARTAANIRSGAVSPIAGMIHALVLLVVILVAAPLAQNIPMTSLAAILLFVAFNMGEWREFLLMRQFTINYRAILVSVFVLTVVIDLTVAVEVGLVMAFLFFVARVSSLTSVDVGEPSATGVRVVRVSGSLFFGSVNKLDPLLEPATLMPKVTIIDLTSLLNLDTTGLEALETIHGHLAKGGAILMLCGMPPQVRSLLARSGFDQTLGAGRLFGTLREALQQATAEAAAQP